MDVGLSNLQKVTYNRSDKFGRHYYRISKEFAHEVLELGKEKEAHPSCISCYKPEASQGDPKEFYYLKAKQEIPGETTVNVSFGVYTHKDGEKFLYATLK